MDRISLVGKFVLSNIQIAEGQIAAINCLGNHPHRDKLVQDLKQNILSLLHLVEISEETFTETSMAMADTLLAESATFRNSVVQVNKHADGAPEFNELTRAVTRAHERNTANLAHKEKIMGDIIAVRFAGIKKEIQNLLSAIDNLPRDS